MAHIGNDWYLAAWADDILTGDKLSQTSVLLLGEQEGETGETGGMGSDPAQGYIIRDWFGPFLLGPVSRFVRGRC
uniref:Uncharacterized protein n=1 Tax=Desulfobacca acetoxidans TaxID=60893 RepID=A0A7C3V9Y1_9BACT